jgi:hypothetical protein
VLGIFRRQARLVLNIVKNQVPMNIACIAWGSLLWKPQPLKLASGWHPDGPLLPLEFARQCDDFPELTLALHEGVKLVPTYWAWLATDDLDTARDMLREREQITPTRPDFIGSIPARDGAQEDPRIAAWLRRKGIDAVVWTALPAKFAGETGRVPTSDEAVAWLDSLQGQERSTAEHYIRRTPAHIDTPYRRQIEKRLGWRPLRESYITQRT